MHSLLSVSAVWLNTGNEETTKLGRVEVMKMPYDRLHVSRKCLCRHQEENIWIFLVLNILWYTERQQS